MQEKVDWLYAAPSAGSGPNSEELEQYLLGKKTVDKLFKEQDERKMAEMAASSSQSVQTAAQQAGGVAGLSALGQNPNNARDLAAKVREDPLLAIKQQEQAAYEAAKRRYVREGKLKDVNGSNAIPVDDKQVRKRKKAEEKEERRHRRDERRRDRHDRHRSREPEEDDFAGRLGHSRHISDDDRRDRRDRYIVNDRSPRERRQDDRSPEDYGRRHHRTRSRSPARRPPSADTGDSRRERENTEHSRAVLRESHHSTYSRRDDYRVSRDPPHVRNGAGGGGAMIDEQRRKAREAATARLAAMQSDAAMLQSSRAERVAEREAEDASVLESEEAARRKSTNGRQGQGPEFMLNEYRKMGEASLGDAIRGKGRGNMIRDRDE